MAFAGEQRGGLAAAPAVTVIGAGLAGSLAALALARRGAAVELIGPTSRAPDNAAPPSAPELEQLCLPAATALSYGSVAGRAAAGHWRRLEAVHGPLGWRSSAVVTHRLGDDVPAQPAAWLQGLSECLPPLPAPLPFSQVDGQALVAALPQALRRAGVLRIKQELRRLEPAANGTWRLSLADGRRLECRRLLLAAGAASRLLWPALPERLRISWAGVIAVPTRQGSSRWLQAIRRGWMVFPRRLRRPELERHGVTAQGERLVVDVGLAPWGEGLLAGQISWLPSEGSGGALESPDAGWLERRLRAELGRLDPTLAELEGRFHLVPVSYCSDGQPLCAALEPGLWALAGCSNAFSTLPDLADSLAAAIVAAGDREV